MRLFTGGRAGDAGGGICKPLERYKNLPRKTLPGLPRTLAQPGIMTADFPEGAWLFFAASEAKPVKLTVFCCSDANSQLSKGRNIRCHSSAGYSGFESGLGCFLHLDDPNRALAGSIPYRVLILRAGRLGDLGGLLRAKLEHMGTDVDTKAAADAAGKYCNSHKKAILSLNSRLGWLFLFQLCRNHFT